MNRQQTLFRVVWLLHEALWIRITWVMIEYVIDWFCKFKKNKWQFTTSDEHLFTKIPSPVHRMIVEICPPHFFWRNLDLCWISNHSDWKLGYFPYTIVIFLLLLDDFWSNSLSSEYYTKIWSFFITNTFWSIKYLNHSENNSFKKVFSHYASSYYSPVQKVKLIISENQNIAFSENV